MSAPSPHAGWIPIGLTHGGVVSVEWCHLGDTPFAEPFFENTVAKALARPFNQLFRPRTPIAALGAFARDEPGLAPSGFVFHMSRCGSTLVAQMLAALPGTIVLSEPAPIDAVLRAEARDEEERIRWLKGMVSALGQRRRGDEARLFIKFDCWDTLDLPLIRKAFPAVPCIFLYRDPVAALASQLHRRGAHTVPGMVASELFGIDRHAALAMPAAEYCARVLAAICDAACRHAFDGELLLVEYRQLPDALAAIIAPHFGIKLAGEQQAALAAVAERHTYTGQPFAATDAPALPEAARIAAETWLAPSYRRLEALRLAAQP